ncbi:MAG: integrity scanning protein DisA [Candidatus Hydrogenedentes bacterium]|nr:integrity scanning protein DisA [Candidatus Hydrogenedentota bacterium]
MPKPKNKATKEVLREAITMVSPGTTIRDAISSIMQSSTGALLCFGDPKRLSERSEGGVQLDAPATSQLLYELSKMDGAIILNEDGTRILYANRFLKPDDSIPSDETGTRHRAAMRIANQAKCVVVAVSERRASVTLYVHNIRHVLEPIPALVNRASQAIQTLEKYMQVLRQALLDLSMREFQDMVTIFDVCKAVQRAEMVTRIANEIEPYILELGVEGRLIDLQVRELVLPVEEADLVIKDYYREKGGSTFEQANEKISELTQEELLNLGSISQALGYGPNLRSVDTYLTPRGYRLLTITHRLTPQIIENLVQKFGSLQQIMRAPKEDLVDVEGVGEVLAERVRVSLNLQRNQLALDLRKDALRKEL